MSKNSYHFKGRSVGTGCPVNSCKMIECESGTVMAITFECHGVQFVHGYCRMAIIDLWGLYCHDPFQRASDSALSRCWAEPSKKGLFIYQPTRLEIVREQEWMLQAR